MAALRAELAAADEPDRKAALQYEIAVLLETSVGNEAAAVQEYLQAFNHDHSFRPPLFALLRLFERRRSVKNLARLYDAEARAAMTADDRSSALVDRGALLEDHLGEVAGARAYYEQAATESPSYLPASLMLERAAFASGDRDGALASIATRAEHARDPVLRSLLLTEVAWAREGNGAIDEAIALMRRAADLPAGRLRSLEQLERLARKHARVPDLVFALEERARLTSAAAQGDDQGQGSGSFPVERIAAELEATSEAAALFYDAAQLRMAHGDAEGAASALTHAIELTPDDALLRYQRMLAFELAGELQRAAEDARFLLERRFPGPFSASLHFRASELALSTGEVDQARDAMTRATQADPGSATARAMLDDLLIDAGDSGERLERLIRAGGDPAAKAQSAFQAAQLADNELSDFSRAEPLYRIALQNAAGDVDLEERILRELYGAARRHGAFDVACEAGGRLLGRELSDAERSILSFSLEGLEREARKNDTRADAILRNAVGDPACGAWAPDLARVRAAISNDHVLLARAHVALAERAESAESAAAHFCAAARAHARANKEDAAVPLLRSAIERVPGHRYAVALLEEILRSRGEAEEVVALLREAAAADQGVKAAETALLLAGAAAEAAQDFPLAAKTYEEAADRDPTSLSPLWALRRLAERTNDDRLLLDVLEKLSEREVALGEVGRSTIELGEHYDLVTRKPELAEGPLRTALLSDLGAAAAVSLLLLPRKSVGAKDRAAAIERLLRDATDAQKPLLERLLVSEALDPDSGVPRERAQELLAGAEESDESGPWAPWTAVRLASADKQGGTARANAWVALGRAISDEAAAGDILLHGLRTMIFAGGAEATDDAFILAQEIEEVAKGGSAAAVAIDETLAGGDDPDARANALAARLEHTGREGKAALESALGRALAAAQRAGEAVEVLRRVVAADDGDLAAWDALRVAAREAKEWADVVKACDRLAAKTQGAFKAELLEEAAAVLMDELEDDAGAEQRLRGALDVDVTRPNAYGRLRDLLAERADSTALLDLSRRRVQVDSDPRELEKIFYEQARVLRSNGDRKGALAVLERLLELTPDHVGGLALAVEIHVALGDFAEAVEKLRTLATADVPVSQKRLARLGAADFLERKLDSPEAALKELAQIESIGLADLALFSRMADVAERAGLYDDAVRALEKGAKMTEDEDCASLERRAGAIHAQSRHDVEAAVAAYERALDAVPDDLAAGEALAELLTDHDARATMSEQFEEAVRVDLEEDPIDANSLRKVRRAAVWRGDRDIERAMLGVLDAMGLADDAERNAHRQIVANVPPLPQATLDDEQLEGLRARGDVSSVSAFARLVQVTLVEADGRSPLSEGKPELVRDRDPNMVRDQIGAIARAVGLTAPTELWVGGGRRGIALTFRKEQLAWVVGDGVTALGPAQRFTVGRLAYAAHAGALPLLHVPPEEGAAKLRAVAIVGETPIGAVDADAEALVPAISRAIPRRVRKSVPDVAVGLTPRDIDRFANGVRLSAARAGALVAGDIGAALEELLGEKPSRAMVFDSKDAFDLVSFWLSPSCSALRRALGICA